MHVRKPSTRCRPICRNRKIRNRVATTDRSFRLAGVSGHLSWCIGARTTAPDYDSPATGRGSYDEADDRRVSLQHRSMTSYRVTDHVSARDRHLQHRQGLGPAHDPGRLEKLGYEGVELRTTHAHKVEVNLTKAEREEVRKRFEDSPVQLAGLGSAFEYQAADPAVVRQEHRRDQGICPAGARHRFAGREGPAQRRSPGGPTSMPRSARSAGRSTRSARTPPTSASPSASRSTAA